MCHYQFMYFKNSFTHMPSKLNLPPNLSLSFLTGGSWGWENWILDLKACGLKERPFSSWLYDYMIIWSYSSHHFVESANFILARKSKSFEEILAIWRLCDYYSKRLGADSAVTKVKDLYLSKKCILGVRP